jgi:hypothetical protein
MIMQGLSTQSAKSIDLPPKTAAMGKFMASQHQK